MRPVGLPWASCVWKTSLGRRSAGGGGSPLAAAAAAASSFSTRLEVSLDLLFFLRSPRGMCPLRVSGATARRLPRRSPAVTNASRTWRK
uniref:Secreted protein n=1 Tax=Denticeps clupeoides TaxID=299321 RepID=A0AAY4B7A9_9TELE